MIYEASMSGALRIILWIVIISLAIRIIARLAMPYIAKKSEEAIRRKMEEMQQQQRPSRREGDVSIESGGRGRSRNDGEFTDYVEIKD